MANKVKQAIEAIAAGDVRGLRKNIQEALVAKVRKALTHKEKAIAKSLIESTSKTSIHEDYKDQVKVAKSELAGVEKNVSSDKKAAAAAAKNLLDAVNKIPSMSLSVDALQSDAKDLHKALSSGKFSSAEKKLVDRISNLLSHPLGLDENFDGATKTSLKEAKDFTVIVTNDIHTKTGQVVVKSDTKLSVSSKDDLAKKVKLSPRELFVDSTHENLFDSIAAKGGTAYVYLDPYDFDISNQLRLGVAKSKQDAYKQEEDSAGDI